MRADPSIDVTQRRLFAQLMTGAPFQPATNYWRAVELAAIRPDDFVPGLGFDLGCGDGRLMRIVMEQAGLDRVVGLDPDPLETSQAIDEGIYLRVHTALGDSIPEEDATFDWVFSNSVLEHIPDIEPVLAEVARILKPGGRFVFTVPRDTFHSCLSGPFWPGRSRQAYLERLDRRCAHVRYWGEQEWRQALTPLGLEMTCARAYLSPRQTRRWELISKITAGALYFVTGGRMQPIALQRRAGIRGRRLGAKWAELLARWLAPTSGDENAGAGSCLLVVARRTVS